ncbi:MAG: hypothetical protein LBF75_04755 [Treponema sp.]|jgi:chromosome segregation ATPase|nr:hypothetical protein [Treponema sp.]
MSIKKILIRRDTTANFERYNPTLSTGEFGIELCPDGNRKVKIGDGSTAWNDLGYAINDAEYTERLDHIQEQEEGQDFLLETLRKAISNLEPAVTALQEANTGQDTKLEGLIDQYTETIQRLSAITTAVANQGSTLNTLLVQIESLVQNQVTDETISAIIQSIAAYDVIIANLMEIQATQGDTLGTLEDMQASQKQTLRTLAQGCTELQDQMQGIETAMSVAHNGLQQVLNQYRIVADTVNELIAIKSSLPGTLGAIENRITNLAQRVEEEGSAGKAKDTEQDQQITSIQGRINQESIHRIDGDSAQAQALEAAVASLNEEIQGETEARTGDTATLDAKIDEEIEARTEETAALDAKIDAEIEARTGETTALDAKIDEEIEARTEETAALDAKIDTEIEARTDTDTALQNHLEATDNPHEVTKEQVGLDQVDNTADSAKPVSTAQAAAIAGALTASNTYTDTLLEVKVDKEPGKGLSQNDFTNAYLNMLQALAGELKVFHDGIAYHADGYEDILVTRYMLRSDLSVTNSSIEISFDGVQFRVVATSATNLRTEVLSAVAGETVTATIRRNSFYNSSTEGQTIQNRVLNDSPYIIDSTIYVDSNDYSIYQIFVGGHWWEINLWPANGKSVVLMSLERRL